MFLSMMAIGLILTVFGLIIAYLSWKKTNKEDIQQATKDSVVISTKLDMVLTSLNNVDNKLNNHDNKFTELEIKVTQAIESSKSAHNRIDELVGVK
jgi:hypothetical protein